VFFGCCNRWFSNVAMRFLGCCNRWFSNVFIFHVSWLILRCCSTTVWDVAKHNFRCCSTYFLMLQYMFFDVALHSFFHICLRCCTWNVSCSLGQGVVGEQCALRNGIGARWGTKDGHSGCNSIPFCSDMILWGVVWEWERHPDAAFVPDDRALGCP
jgi:hypothetical protein